MENTPVNEQELQDKVMLTANGHDYVYDYDQLGVTFDSSEREILQAVDGIIREINMTLVDDDDPERYSFRVVKSTNNHVIHIYPKDGAGN